MKLNEEKMWRIHTLNSDLCVDNLIIINYLLYIQKVSILDSN